MATEPQRHFSIMYTFSDDDALHSVAKRWSTAGAAQKAADRWQAEFAEIGLDIAVNVVELVDDGRGGKVAASELAA